MKYLGISEIIVKDEIWMVIVNEMQPALAALMFQFPN